MPYRYAKNRISSLINTIVCELYYLTGYLPAKLKAKQAVFKAKQEQALNQILKHHQIKQTTNKDQIDKGGFDEWERNRTTYGNRHTHNQSTQQPIPPIRKSKLLSAAIVSNRNATSHAKLMPNNSVIATISSPNSTQTLQVRSSLLVHPSPNDLMMQTSSGHQPSKHRQLPISPIPFRPEFYQQRQFQSAPQLPLKYGNQAHLQTPNLVNQNRLNYPNRTNQTFHNFEPIAFSPINVPAHPSLIRNNQVFARKTLPPSFLNRPQYFSNNSHQLPHSSTFISSTAPFDHPTTQMNTVRLRSLSAPDKVNGSLNNGRNAFQSVPYFSPIQTTPFDQSSSNFGYNPSFRRHPHHRLIRYPAYYNQHAASPVAARNLYPDFNSDSLNGNLIASDLHRIETINRMRLAQLAKENSVRRQDDYLRPIDYLDYANNDLVADDFEADLEEEANSYLFHKSLSKRLQNHSNKTGLANEELTTSSGRGSSNLDNSPKIDAQNTSKGEPQSSVLKSNSSSSGLTSSGFASRAFSITGSPDKQQPSSRQSAINLSICNSGSSIKIPKKSSTNEVSEADENYEFDLETRLNALYKRSRSTCTTPLARFYESDKDPFLMHRKQQQQLRRAQQQFKHIDHSRLINTPTQMSDENFDDYYMNDVDTAADEEIRFLNDHLVNRGRTGRLPNLAALHRLHHHQSLMEHNASLHHSRAVFSDSELYDHQFNHHTNGREYMSRCWRKMRCEQLKQELNEKLRTEFRLKYNLNSNPKPPMADYRMKNETAC